MELGLRMTQLLELTDSDFKTTILNILKHLENVDNIPKERGISAERKNCKRAKWKC